MTDGKMFQIALMLVATQAITPANGRNLLLRRPVTQSSIYPEYDGPPLAVDGNANPDWHAGSCSSTEYEDYPWISVDMGEKFAITMATITSRQQTYSNLQNVVVGVTDVASDPELTANPTARDFIECGRIDRVVGPAETVTVTCPQGGVVGRHLVVMIDSSSTNTILTVCEITAKGYAFLRWTSLPQSGHERADIEGFDHTMDTPCTSLVTESPIVLQGTLRLPFKQLTAHVAVKNRDKLFDTYTCHAGFGAQLMTHTGTVNDTTCRPFCGMVQGCDLEAVNGGITTYYKLICRCHIDQCFELLLHLIPTEYPFLEICHIFVELD